MKQKRSAMLFWELEHNMETWEMSELRARALTNYQQSKYQEVYPLRFEWVFACFQYNLQL